MPIDEQRFGGSPEGVVRADRQRETVGAVIRPTLTEEVQVGVADLKRPGDFGNRLVDLTGVLHDSKRTPGRVVRPCSG